jgi:hypothetical protein
MKQVAERAQQRPQKPQSATPPQRNRYSINMKRSGEEVAPAS